MKKQYVLLLMVVGLVLTGAACSKKTVQTKNSTTNVAVTQDKVETDGTIVKPDGTMVKLDGTMIKPDGTKVSPDGTMLKPDGTVEKPDGTMVKPDGTMVKPDGTMVKPDGTMIGPDGKIIDQPKNTNSTTTNTTSKATYTDYSAASLAAAEAKGRTVLYFHAPWCPICAVLEPQLKAQIGTFPGDVTMLKVDYDSSTDLKKMYGVTYQHTFVQVDADGKKLKLWNGGDVETIKQNII